MKCIFAISWMFYTTYVFASCYDAETFCSNGWIYSPNDCLPYLSTTLPDLYQNYCLENDLILWKTGVIDGFSVINNIEIDYDFIICKESFSLCAYVPLYGSESPDCGAVNGKSGVTFGGGIDLGHQTLATLTAIGASADTLSKLDDYIGLIQTEAAEKICNQSLTVDHDEAYDLTIALMYQYTEEMQTWYDAERNQDTLAFIELPLGIKTVLTSIHWKWGDTSKYPTFWSHIKANDFENAIEELRAWYSDSSSDERLRSEANIMEASLGCVSNIDCVFLVDESGSVGSTDFTLSLNWIEEFIGSFDESSLNQESIKTGARFGVATFSSSYTDHIYLNQYSSFNEYQTKISSISYSGGSTSLGAALQFIGVSQFVETRGMRSYSLGIPRLLIVLTDGIAQDDVTAGVATLSHLNLNIIAIGIGGYDIDQLRDITTDSNIYAIDAYTELSEILYGVLTQTCFIPTQLNIGDVIDDISVQNGEIKFFYFKTSGNENENIVLDIKQTKGCVYVYISYCIQYPSYYVSDVKFTSCAQSFKQIVLSPIPQDCSAYEGVASNRRLLELSDSVYVAFEGRNVINETSLFNMSVSTCNINDTEIGCSVGTNYDPLLNVDPPYSYGEPLAFNGSFMETTNKGDDDDSRRRRRSGRGRSSSRRRGERKGKNKHRNRKKRANKAYSIPQNEDKSDVSIVSEGSHNVNGNVKISLSTSVLENIWAALIVFISLNTTICYFYHKK